jgi:hypothetical protein
MKTILTTTFIFCSLVLAAQKTVNKNYSNVKRIQITTSSGDITFKKSRDAQVKLNLEFTYDEDEYTPQFEQEGDKLVLTEKFSRGNHSGSSTWKLEIPENVNVNINTGSGNISLDHLTADVKSNTGSGDIELTSLKGSFNSNTGSGNINANGIDGEIKLNTGSGDISLEEGSGNFSLNVGSGNISLNRLNGDFSVNAGSGDLRAKALSLTGDSKFNTGSGDAEVALADALNHDISVNSGSGDATLNFNGSEISGEVTMTASKSRGKIVAPFKFDKEETIDDDNGNERIQKTAKLGTKDIQIKVSTGTGTAEIKK